jgi:selenocysteine-specific elongation factor
VGSIVIGTAGHIDHGKSALVRALTGTDPDRLKEEQERGITIDLGFAHLQADAGAGGGTVNLAFVDVPGHERFVKNMLAGVGGMDLVMLVIAADESVMPQTREHFHICRLLRVPTGLVVLTKSDLADAETLDLARLEVRELVAGSFLEDAPVVAVSSRTGDGLALLKNTLVTMASAVPVRQSIGPVRLPIDRVFSIKGFGTVVTGTLASGRVEIEQVLTVLPPRRNVKVRGLQVHGQPQGSAEAGQRVAVNLGGVEVADVVRGHTLADRGAFEPTRRLDVRLDLLPDTRALRQGARVRFHCGTAEILGRVALARESQPEDGRERNDPDEAAAYARMHLESPAVVTRGDRFILRAYSPLATIGGGVVLDPGPARGAIRSAAGIERFRRMDAPGADVDRALVAFVNEAGGAGFPRLALVHRAGLSYAEADQAVERLLGSGAANLIGDLLVSPQVRRELGARLEDAIRGHHETHPLDGGLPREEARDRLFRRAAPEVFDAVLEDLAGARRVVARDRLALEGRQVSLSDEEARVQAALERVFADARLTPPDIATACAAAHAEVSVADRIVSLLVRTRTLVRIESLVFHAAALDELKADVRRLKAGSAPARLDVAAFKERYGVTRKFAIPLLEYLDRERVTRRVGESRIVL